MNTRFSLLKKLSVAIILFSTCFAGLDSRIMDTNDQLNTTLITHLSGGACETLVLKEDTVIIGSGNSLIALFINSDSAIQKISSNLVQGQIRDLIATDDFVYVLSEGEESEGWYSVISLVDISSISSDFRIVGSIKLQDFIEDFTYSENRIFLYCGESAELNIINIENPIFPYIEKVITRYDMQDNNWPTGPVQFEFKDSLMYYVGDEIVAMKVSDSLEFEIVARCGDILDMPIDMVINDSYLYISQMPGFSIYDISTPESVSLTERVENFDGSDYSSLFIKNDYLYLLSEMLLLIYDIGNPQFPELIASYYPDDALTDIAVFNSRMYISQYGDGLIALDHKEQIISEPIGKYQPFGFLKNLYIKGNKLYAITTNSEFYIIDISDLASPTTIGSIMISGYPGDIIVSDSIAYIAGPKIINIIDVTDPANILKVDSIDINEYSPSLDLVNEYLYVADGLRGLKIFDVSNLISPILVGSYSNDRLDAAHILVKGNYAYILNFAYRRLSIFDISDSSSPSLIQEIQVNVGLYAKSSIWLNRLYIPTSQSITDIYSQNVEIFDISNPGLPIPIGKFNLDDKIFSICGTSGDYLFTISRLNGLKIYNITNPSQIQEKGYYTLSGSYQWNGSLIVRNNIVMIGNNNGLYIIQNNNNSLPSLVNDLSDTTITRNSEFLFEYNAFDVDGDKLSFQLNNQYPGFHIDEELGVLEYVPGVIQQDTSYQLIVAINDTKSTKRDTAEITFIGANSIYTADSQIPDCFALGQNYPNPFNSNTTIMYNIPEKSHVKISIYDIYGRSVHTLVDQDKNPGRYNVIWDASGMSSGIYFCQFQVNDIIQTKKLLLVK